MTESATGVSATSEVVALVPRKSEKWTAIGFLLGLVGSARMQYHRSLARKLFFVPPHARGRERQELVIPYETLDPLSNVVAPGRRLGAREGWGGAIRTVSCIWRGFGGGVRCKGHRGGARDCLRHHRVFFMRVTEIYACATLAQGVPLAFVPGASRDQRARRGVETLAGVWPPELGT